MQPSRVRETLTFKWPRFSIVSPAGKLGLSSVAVCSVYQQ